MFIIYWILIIGQNVFLDATYSVCTKTIWTCYYYPDFMNQVIRAQRIGYRMSHSKYRDSGPIFLNLPNPTSWLLIGPSTVQQEQIPFKVPQEYKEFFFNWTKFFLLQKLWNIRSSPSEYRICVFFSRLLELYH